MELKVNGYVKLVEDLDCGMAVLPKDTPFRIVKIEKMVTVINELIGAGGFSKGEMEEYFVESNEEEYNAWRDLVLSRFEEDEYDEE